MKIYIETLGCPKNVVDSEMTAGLLERNGHEIVNSPEKSEVIMVNTCGFIHDAKQESIDMILEMAQYKLQDCKLLIVSGCLGERYGRELMEELPEADVVMGVNDYHEILNIINNVENQHHMLYNSPQTNSVLNLGVRKLSTPKYAAYLKIAEGCNNFCSYCIIPYIRGSFRSRPFNDILQEARDLAGKGCREITLVAQDVTNYGIDLYHSHRIHELAAELSGIDGLKWIRLMYCYPHLISDELIKVIAENEKICRYIDIPIQHCSNHILKSMNRKADKKQIIDVINKLRTKVPGIHIRTTLIVGFPGETKKDFQELKQFVKDMKFERLGVFEYSPEEGTPAAKMENQIDEDTKKVRRDEIMEIQQQIALDLNTERIGKKVTVLVEEEIEEENIYIGRTQYDAFEIDNSVMFTSERQIETGDLIKIKITDAMEYDLIGEDIYEPAQ